ncbi:MAG TPA: cyclic nucleotide-binding domain-containing protein [Thermoanaerobaculia bacterium]|nr:cyclic nucleotide-binding domain-containing protein [Thermoanaerobaculia bacterium]
MPAVQLTSFAVFAGVRPDRLALLAAQAEEKSFSSNQIIFRRGDRCDGLWVISTGGVQLRTEIPGQAIDRLVDLGPGEVFGEAEVLDDAPRVLTARALGPTTLVRIPAEPLRELFRDHSAVENYLRTLGVRRRSARVRAMLAPSSRREPRIWVDRDVWITLGPRGESLRVRLIDLSNEGACLSRVPADWTLGKELSFTLGTLEKLALLQVRGTVRWRSDFGVGILFEDPGPALRRRIEQALRELVPL